jgi:hypothetical protein
MITETEGSSGSLKIGCLTNIGVQLQFFLSTNGTEYCISKWSGKVISDKSIVLLLTVVFHYMQIIHEAYFIKELYEHHR